MSTHEFYFRYTLPDGLDPGDAFVADQVAGGIRRGFAAGLAAALRVEVDAVKGYVTVYADPEPGEVLAAVLEDISDSPFTPSD